MLNTSISLGTASSETSQQRANYTPFPAPQACPLPPRSRIWRLRGLMEQGTCSLTRLTTRPCDHPLQHAEGGVSAGWGRGRYNHPSWQQSEQIQHFAKPHPELSSHHCYPTHKGHKRKIIVPSNQKHRNLVWCLPGKRKI